MTVIARYIFLGLILLVGAAVASEVSADPLVTNPVPGTQLSGDTETFQWSANGTSVSEWWLYVGTSEGGSDIRSTGSLSSGTTSITVSSLPTDGSTVWVRLWYVSGGWQSVDFQYTSAGGSGGSGEPAIIIPVPGTQLSGDSETFQWSANGEDVSEWWLYVGTSEGGNDLHDSGSLGSGVNSASVSGLPTDGSTVWVRLWYVSDHWHEIDFQYTSASGIGEPAIIDPVPGTQLSGDTETFQWSANGISGVSEWQLYAGTSIGGNDLHDSGSLGSGVNSDVVSGLPTDGSIVWVRLQYITDQTYSIDYQYTSASGIGEPAIIDPVPGTQLSGDTETFQWSANGVSGVSEWQLYAGTSIGGNDLHDSGPLSIGVNSDVVSGLPTDGSIVWVRLQYITDQTYSIDYQYISASGIGDPAIIDPVPGTQLSGDTETFQWSANGTSVSEWWLYVGTSEGGSDIRSTGSLSSGTTSITVSSLPTDGSTVWVRLWYVSGGWQSVDFQYTSAGGSGGSGEPAIIIPVPGTQLSGDSETFQWSANGEDVSEWWLYVGTSEGGNDLHDSGSLGSGVNSASVSGLPTDGSTVWVRLWYVSDHWHEIDFQYTASLDGIWIVSPTQNDLMNNIDVDVQASATGFPQDWSVEFVLDNQFGNAVPGTNIQGTSIWQASLDDLDKASYTLTAVMVNGSGTQQSDSHEISFDVGDYYVAFGDSISEGIGDDISLDNQSLDGRNSSNGYTPILNDLLTAEKGFPHSVAVQGISGYEASDGLAEIGNALSAHPQSSHFLIQFGTNDSGGDVPSGRGKNIGDNGYPGTFKDNMQRIIDAVQGAGKVTLLAKAPIRYGDCSGPSNCQSYMQEGTTPENAAANGFLRDYNLVVDELIILNGLEPDPIVGSSGPLLVAPDLYSHFSGTGLDGEGKSPRFFDWLHPNGVGYQDMACLWLDSLTTATCVPP